MISKKIENFWYYHKIKVFVAIFLIVFILLGWNFNAGGLSDLEIGYVMDNHIFYVEKLDEAKILFESIINGQDGKNKDVLFVPLAGPRLELELGLGICHIILIDKDTLAPFIGNHFFESLEYYVEEYNIDISDFPEVIADPLGTNNPEVYALPIKDMQFLLDMGFPEDFYFTIRLPKPKDKDDAMRVENAHIVLDYILNYSQ